MKPKVTNDEQQHTASFFGLKRCLHFWPAAIARFVNKSGFVHASSLSFTTLIGLIPVLAVGLSVATSLMFKDGDEGREEVEVWIDTMVKTVAPMLDLEIRDSDTVLSPTNSFPSAVPEPKSLEGFQVDKVWDPSTDNPSLSDIFSVNKTRDNGRRRKVASQIAGFVSKIHTRTIGMTSVILFLAVAIMLLRAIERTFNQVWEIPENRSWGAGVAQYWAGLTLGPFLLIVGTGLSSSSILQDFTIFLSGMAWFGKIFLFIIAWVITGSACALIYRIMTNTKVNLRASFAGGLSAGLLLQLNSQLSVVYFSNVATANKIYGSLGAIPILLLGLNVSWIILIFGAHVAYLVQFPTQEGSAKAPHEGGNNQLSIFNAMRLLQIVADQFKNGEEALDIEALSVEQGLDLRDTTHLVDVLVGGGFLFQGFEPDTRVTLAKPADCITLEEIYQFVGCDEKIPQDASLDDPCVLAYTKVMDTRNKSASAITLQDLLCPPPSISS